MLRVVDNFSDRTGFDNLTVIHNRYPITDIAHHREIMADKQEGQLTGGVQFAEQLQDFSLNGNIERRDRLVGHEQIRIQCECPGNADALALPATEFVWIAKSKIGFQTNRFKESSHHFKPFRPRSAYAVDGQDIDYRIAHLQTRIERSIGILKNHLNLLSIGFQSPALVHGNIAAFEDDFSGGWNFELYDRLAQRAFAAATFADQTKDFAGTDMHRHILHGMDSILVLAVDNVQFFDCKQLFHLLVRRVQARDGGHELPGVFVLGVIEHLFREALLDDATPLHDVNPIGKIGNNAEVVGDH